MMNNELIKVTMNGVSRNRDYSILSDVENDNVFSKLNELTGGCFSYDVDILNQLPDRRYLIKVNLYTQFKCVCGFAFTSLEDINNAIAKALVSACKKGFDYKKNTTIKTKDENAVLTTLDDLDNLEKELGIDSVSPQIENKTENKPKRDFGIREDQIAFMKTFQEMLCIDTTEKFDSYVSAWNAVKNTGINTKIQLVQSGAVAVDNFISWVKEVYKDNIAENNFVCPTDTELGTMFN